MGFRGYNVIFVPSSNDHWAKMPDEARPRRCEDTRGITALDDKGEINAVCLFDSWAANSCQIHIYIANPIVLKHGFAEEVFKYAFSEESGREVIIGVTPSDNAMALKFIRHIGFKDTGRIADGHQKGVDYILTTMRKHDCKWLKRLDATKVH